MLNLLKVLFVVTLASLRVSAAHAGTSMITGKYTSQPIGHAEFCKDNVEKCKKNPVPKEVFHGDDMTLLQKVTVGVNHDVLPMTDFDIWGAEEKWSYPIMKDGELVGDCEDTVLLKRFLLFKAGIPAQYLLITVVRKQDGEGHAVLTIRTSRGDFILDNLTDEVVRWDHTNYRFIKRQSIKNSGKWVRIVSQPDAFTASVR